ncbi:hypothetical protein SBA6_570003 [Candidatus Sulfopaludibacter sp. SbA6]|nr:hypothetical protein SBA6_570003 [Candidatus Sulfopaludibacter sp. SbA6]
MTAKTKIQAAASPIRRLAPTANHVSSIGAPPSLPNRRSNRSAKLLPSPPPQAGDRRWPVILDPDSAVSDSYQHHANYNYLEPFYLVEAVHSKCQIQKAGLSGLLGSRIE